MRRYLLLLVVVGILASAGCWRKLGPGLRVKEDHTDHKVCVRARSTAMGGDLDLIVQSAATVAKEFGWHDLKHGTGRTDLIVVSAEKRWLQGTQMDSDGCPGLQELRLELNPHLVDPSFEVLCFVTADASCRDVAVENATRLRNEFEKGITVHGSSGDKPADSPSADGSE